MKVPLIALVLVLVSGCLFFGYYYFNKDVTNNFEKVVSVNKTKPLEKYSIENLSKTKFNPSVINFGEVIKEEEEFVSRVFYFEVDGAKVSGQINYPKILGTYPVVIMNRGYIDREEFKTGDGTRRTSEEFVKNGFITLAPDFLGYGESDNPPNDVMEDRFLTYVTSATLLNSLENLNGAFGETDINVKVDTSKVGLWGHSNGGQITLTLLEITGVSYPTVLWAPVSKPFPYSILYYTDDFDDHGKALRKVVSEFEKDYEADKYSLTNHLEKIKAPLQIHQGVDDEAVPVRWSNDFVGSLKEKDKDVVYFTYLGDDHNFTKGSWQTVVLRDIEFFREKFK